MPMKPLVARAAAIVLAVVLLAPAFADEITPSHLAAARDAMIATKANRGFDDLLPALSQQVQSQLISARPDVYMQISDTVNAIALTITNRRTDLDNDAARVWANAFSEDELKAIAAFYKTPAGAKFVDVGPKVFGDSVQVAKQWSDRVREELFEKAREELKKQNIDF